MIIGTVIGTVVAPIQHPFYDGKTLLLVLAEQPHDGSPAREGTLLAVDRVGAGVGEKVLVMKEGSSARFLFEQEAAPVRTVIVGVIDEIEMAGQTIFFKGTAD